MEPQDFRHTLALGFSGVDDWSGGLMQRYADARLYAEKTLGSGKLWLVDRDGGEDLHIEVTPMITGAPDDPFSSLHATMAIWLTTLQHRQSPSAERLRETYDLTAAEADILVELVEGHSIAEIARSRSVARETVRGQFKALMKKTRTRRQADLVRFVLTGPVGSRTEP